MPFWGWLLIAIGVVIAFFGWRSYRFVARFRARCRTVREELAAYVKEHHPEVEIVGEKQGNFLLRTAGQTEGTWYLDKVYTAVARLPGMGADPAARREVYQHFASNLIPTMTETDEPLSLAVHGSRIMPRLVPPDFPANVPAPLPHRPVPNLPLETVYVLDYPGSVRYLNDGDLKDLGIGSDELHELALNNLRSNFPVESIRQAAAGEPTAIQFGDSYDAARLLLIAERLPDDGVVIALVPHRDLMVLLPGALAADMTHVREGLKLTADPNHPAVLPGNAVRVSRDGFELI